MKLCVTNENFETSITSLLSKSFFTESITYRFLYDNLKPKYKKYLLENDLDKSRITIYLTKDSKNKEIIKKYKHQIVFLKSEKHDIYDTLNNIFRGKLDKNQLLIDLSYFTNMYILNVLESTSMSSYIVARRMAEIEKYVFSPYFKYLIVYNLYDCKAIAKWVKK